MSLESNKAIVRRYYEEIENAGKWELVDELLTPDYQGNKESPGHETDRDQLKAGLAYIRNSFPDYRLTVEDLIAEGDKVFARCVGEGTHTGDYLGVPGTGKHIRASTINVWLLRDGKLAGSWWVGDVYGVMQQIGAIPTPSPESSPEPIPEPA